MSKLLTPEDFMKERPLCLEEKVNILFENFKSNLHYLFTENNLSINSEKNIWEDNIIFENEWLQEEHYSKQMCNNPRFLENNLFRRINISGLYWSSNNIYDSKDYQKIGLILNISWYKLNNKNINIIYFIKDVYGKNGELYKKDTIIIFNNYSGKIEIVEEEELEEYIKAIE